MSGALYFSRAFLDAVAARNDPKTRAGWHVTYADRVSRDHNEIATWIGANDRVMDIGCGFAGVDALLAQSGQRTFRLVDGDGSGERRGGFSQQTAPWYDVRIGTRLVCENAARASVEFVVVPPAPEPWPCDVVISLKSWGHHYAVECYLDLVKRSLKPEGLVIMDIRNGTDGRATMEAAGFSFKGRIGGTAKCDRILFMRRRA